MPPTATAVFAMTAALAVLAVCVALPLAALSGAAAALFAATGAVLFALVAPPAVLAQAGATALFAVVTQPAVLADTPAAALFANAAPLAVLADAGAAALFAYILMPAMLADATATAVFAMPRGACAFSHSRRLQMPPAGLMRAGGTLACVRRVRSAVTLSSAAGCFSSESESSRAFAVGRRSRALAGGGTWWRPAWLSGSVQPNVPQSIEPLTRRDGV